MSDKRKQLVLLVEGTADLGLHWLTIRSNYLDKLIRSFCCCDEATRAAIPDVELALVIFNTHGLDNPCLVQRSSWTREMEIFFNWLSELDIHFSGSGSCNVAIAEGLAECLLICTPNGSQTQQNEESFQRHCILVAANNPHPYATPVYQPPNSYKSDAQLGSHLSDVDAESVAKSFPLSFVSLSVICPRQLPKLQEIYNVGKRNPSSADPTVSIDIDPNHIVLISEDFIKDCADINALLIPNSVSSADPMIIDVTSVSDPPPTSVSPVEDSMMNQQLVSVGNSPITGKLVETWKGALCCYHEDRNLCIAHLKAFRRPVTSEKLTEGWPSKLQISRTISQDQINNLFAGLNGEKLVFQVVNQHAMLGQLHEKKIWLLVLLPSQVMLLGASQNAGPSFRLRGVVFPKEVISNRNVSSSQQQPQQLSLSTSPAGPKA